MNAMGGATTGVFEKFEELLKRTQEIFLEENSLLKEKKLSEHAALMSRKAELLKQLDAALKSLQENRESKTTTEKERARGLQDRIMRLLMLDRENEQLLVKLSSFNATQSPKINTQALEKVYKKL